MKGDTSPLSSEQALDDYFSALLSLEEPQEQQDDNEDLSLELSELESESCTIETRELDSSAGESAPLDENHCDDPDDESLASCDAVLSYEAVSSYKALPQEASSQESLPDEEWSTEADQLNDIQETAEPQKESSFESGAELANDIESDPYLAQRQLMNTQPLAQTELAEIDQLPDLDNLEKLFSGLQAQIDSEVDIAEVQIDTAVATIVEPDVDEAEQEIQAWDIEFENQVEQQSTVFEASSTVALNPEPDTKDPLESADIEPEAVSVSELSEGNGGAKVWQNGERDQAFQVLYFDVNGVTFAVPLDELGGIHQLTSLSHLIGRPAWYLGLQTSRDDKLDVVDTAMWAMSDVLTGEEYKDAYEYVVMLGESQWGLACTALKGTEMLTSDKIRWRETAGKRPWLAGMVKEQMCALVHVSELIGMLNAGLDVKSVQ
ncbi:chemotaxis protein CheW [Vibrio hippocampi]|uniref:CheW-like domain-containing protein n=1 Tax=Vibrio hippocampi TaxID=654686 RepID=A0ABM8ZF98_9VIBR|nr:chemotaxis protein CheW [Vibrio hippocampi]CAH0525218.1 hypothetical protein VHP8226_00860 [Vibrio hippocampi]